MNIEQLKLELQDRIKRLDKRIERFEAPSNYDWSKKIERLYGEALAYETVLKMIDE